MIRREVDENMSFFPLKESFPTLKMLNQLITPESKKDERLLLEWLVGIIFQRNAHLKVCRPKQQGDFSKIKHYQKWALGSDVFLYTVASKTSKTETHQASDSEKLCLLSLLSA